MPVTTNSRTIEFSPSIVLKSGLLVGTLDILSAFVDYYVASGKNPLAILNYIASGILGKGVLTTGGTATMLTGLLLHYVIAFSFTVLFFWLCAHTKLLSVNWVLRGFLYGIFVWMVMNLVVVQLSLVPHGPISAMKFNNIMKSALILIGMIGLPLSYIVFKYAGTYAANNSA